MSKFPRYSDAWNLKVRVRLLRSGDVNKAKSKWPRYERTSAS